MTSDEIKSKYPLLAHLETMGVKLKGSGNQRQANRCPLKQHGNDHFCVSVKATEGLWHCCDCGQGGDVIRWMALERGKPDAEILKELSETFEVTKPKLVKSYDYTDENGAMLFQSCRFEPKTFRARHKVAESWVWSMDGVRRVLYNLPKVIEAEEVIVTEGEKDADSLNAIGLVATTNVGGATNWLDAYGDTLADKHVIIMPDNDEKGLKHRDVVIANLAGKAKSIRIVMMPAPHKDVSDFMAANPSPDGHNVIALIADAKLWHPGADVPIKDMADMEIEYAEFAKKADSCSLRLNDWLPGLSVRPMVPGEVLLFVGDTATGKTLWCANLILNSPHLPTLFFELELPGTILFERFVSMATDTHPLDVEANYRNGKRIDWRSSPLLKHFHVCDLSGLDLEGIEKIIQRAELRMGKKPVLVIVDYVGLVKAKGTKRYEKTSDVAEGLKVLAKTTNTIIVVVSQRSRPADGEVEVGLHDARETGALENSCQLMIGAWRDALEPTLLHLRVLKSTKGGSGNETSAWLNPKTLRLEQQKSAETYQHRADQ